MKSALFVDFDNVFSGLRRLDQECAEQFARNPTAWMNWLIESLELPEPNDGTRRRVLVRRCYLNPQAYQRFRPSFNLAGFEIIDCPALTSEGKTSTDIHMVLDMVDLLQLEAHYDEFIVFSADADFTPVLRKLRRWDRRTTVLAIGFPSAAYRASADLLIDQDEFVRKALTYDGPVMVKTAQPASLEQEMLPKAPLATETVSLIRHLMKESDAPVPLPKVASLIPRKVDDLDVNTWGGYGSFRALVESLDLAPLAVTWDGGGMVYDPARHSLLAAPRAPTGGVKPEGNHSRVVELIRAEVAKSKHPLPCAFLATLLTTADPSLGETWGGKGTFRRFLDSLKLAPVEIDWITAGGVAYIPMHHTDYLNDLRQVGRQGADEWDDDDLYKAAKQIHELTDVPLLSPKRYRNLFELIVADTAVSPFHVLETAKRVRDLCRESGLPVSRTDVTYVLRGLLMRGYEFTQGAADVEKMAEKLADNVRSLCLREQVMLDTAMENVIQRWIQGR